MSNEEHDMFHAVFVKDDVSAILADGGNRRLRGILRDVRKEICPDAHEIIDDLEPMNVEYHKEDGQIEYFQAVDAVPENNHCGLPSMPHHGRNIKYRKVYKC